MATTLRRSVLQLIKKHKIAAASVTARHQSSVSEENNLLKSVYKDVPVTNDLVTDFVWQNLDRWPDKTATVSVLIYLCVTHQLMLLIGKVILLRVGVVYKTEMHPVDTI